MNLALCFLSLLSLMGAVCAEISWSGEYNATALPAAPEWGGSQGPNTSAEITPEGLHLVDGGTEKGELHCYTRPWNARPDRGAIAEITLKVISCTAPAGMCLLVADGKHEDAVTFYPDRIELNNAGLKYAMDTTDAFHTYQVRIAGVNIEVWVDGKLVLDGWGAFQKPAHEARNVLMFGSISSPAKSEAIIREVRYYTAVPSVTPIAGARNVVVYYKEGVYACFPSLTQLPDGTLFTSFATRVRRSHIDSTGGSARYLSKDGGNTWEPTDQYMTDPRYVREDGTVIRPGAQGWIYVPETELERVKASGRRWMKAREGTIAYLGGPQVSYTYPDGRKETRELPNPAPGGMMVYNSSAFLHQGKLWMTAVYGFDEAPKDGGRGTSSVWVVRSEDDGNTWEVLPVAMGTPGGLGFDESALCDNGRGEILCVMRPTPETYNSYQCFSRDGGKTWSAPQDCGFWGYPSNLLRLKDGLLLCTYGYRRDPMGVRAVLSSDGGHTWDVENETVIRCDGWGSGSDLGYPISVEIEPGHIFTLYYFNDRQNVTHIAGTHWQVP